MTKPTWSEVAGAFGYSFGWITQKLRQAQRLAVGGLILIWGTLAVAYLLPPLVSFAATLPPVSVSVVALVAAAGFFLFGAAAFSYVLFAFLSKLSQSDAGIRRDFQSIIHKVANPMRTIAGGSQPATGGSFTPYSDDRAFQQETFNALVEAKILKPEDNLDDLIKNGEFDFDSIKDRAVGG